MSLKKLGRYEIVAPLGQGAMGLVYEAHDPHINRAVAIKTIRVDQLAHDMAAEFEARFRCETQAGGRLQHPNIIGVYDAGRDQGLAFMVMELVRGGDLRQQLKPGQPLGFERSMGLMKELLSALNFAHEQGIVHRDIKPANVMLDLKGRVKLGDFGVAQIADAGGNDGGDGGVDGVQSMRDQGSTVGTLKYLSPEQIDGSKLDSRADLFAAGVVLYQLLTGNKPFEGDSDFAVMQAIAQRDPARPTSLNLNLPAAIDAVVFKALAKNRDDRYASAWDFALALRAVTLQATPTGAVAQRPRTPGISLTPAARTPALETPADEATRLARPAAPGAPGTASRAPDQTLLRAEQARVAEVAAAVAAATAQARQVARDAEAARQQAESAEQVRAALERQRAAAAEQARQVAQDAQDAEAARQRAEQAERTREALELQRAQAQAEQEELAELAWTQAQEEEQARRAALARDAAAAEVEREARRVAALAVLAAQAAKTPAEAPAGPVLGAAAGAEAAVQASALPAAASSIHAVALPVARGHGRVVAVVTTLAALVGGGWFATRDAGKPPLTMAPTARASAPAPTPTPTSTFTSTAAPTPTPATQPLTVAAQVPAPAPEPVAVTAPLLPAPAEKAASSPASTGATLAQAEALERRDLNAAVAAYATLATGADRKSAALAARRLWTLYRDGAKGLAANPQQAQRWYDRAKQVGAKLPEWVAERAGQAQALPPPASLPAAPRLAPAGTVNAPPAEVNVPAVAPSPAPAAMAREVGVATPLAAPLPTAGVAAKPSVAELFERGQKLEGTSLRQAEGAYRDAAQQGHGASQKRLWELLLKAGRASEAVRYQKEAWDQQVPGVPEPKSAIRL